LHIVYLFFVKSVIKKKKWSERWMIVGSNVIVGPYIGMSEDKVSLIKLWIQANTLKLKSEMTSGWKQQLVISVSSVEPKSQLKKPF
jgi:hypothetical protein